MARVFDNDLPEELRAALSARVDAEDLVAYLDLTIEDILDAFPEAALAKIQELYEVADLDFNEEEDEYGSQ